MVELPVLLLIVLALGLSFAVIRSTTRADVLLTKRDFAWLGWKPTHVHYKGGLYEESTRAIATDRIEAGESVVLYVHESGATYVRPARMFDEVSRFAPIPEEDNPA
jgi:hypothetical protein